MTTANQEDFEFFQHHCHFMSECKLRNIPYPKFHIFD